MGFGSYYFLNLIISVIIVLLNTSNHIFHDYDDHNTGQILQISSNGFSLNDTQIINQIEKIVDNNILTNRVDFVIWSSKDLNHKLVSVSRSSSIHQKININLNYVLELDRLNIIVLNGDTNSFDGEWIKWLENKIKMSVSENKKIWLVGYQYPLFYIDGLIEKFSDHIKSQFFTSSVNRIIFNTNMKNYFSHIYLNSAIENYDNTVYRIYEYDRYTFEILDFHQFKINNSECQKISAKNHFKINDLSTKSWYELSHKNI